ncbi:MAG: hypothetical protein WC813_03640 [Patescibacteria group bacterium]|jgi:hypothetical protein
MTRKTEIGLAVGVLVLLIIVLLAIFLRPGSNPQPATSNQEPSQPSTSTTTPATETPVAPEAIPVANPQTTTMIFVERFASYSSESDFANVTDVLPLVTSTLATSLQSVAQDQRAAQSSSAYYGISTKVISQKTVEESNSSATIIVSTQRVEAIGNPSNTKVRYQDITVRLIKEGDTWKVNDFSWGE